MKRSEIWMVNLGAQQGSIQGGLRPAIVVSNDMANSFSSVIHIIPLTTKEKTQLRTHVKVGTNCGLKMESIAMAEQNMLVDKSCFQVKIGQVDDKIMSKIDTAILVQFGLYDKVKNIINRVAVA